MPQHINERMPMKKIPECMGNDGGGALRHVYGDMACIEGRGQCGVTIGGS